MKFLNRPDDNLHDMMTVETSEMSKKNLDDSIKDEFLFLHLLVLVKYIS